MTPYSQHVGSKQGEPPFANGSSGNGSTGASLGAGVLLSVALHAALVGFVIFGLPIFWHPEPLPEAIGIELAQLSDITAAPKVQKEGKPNKQPEPQPEVQKQASKEETPPPPPNPPAAAAPPPPPPPEEEEVVEPIPDPEAEKKKEEELKKKAEEEKKKKTEEEKKKKEAERKKKEEEFKKQQKKDDKALDTLLANVLQQKPAPEPEKKPAKKAEAKPVEPSTGPQTENVSEIPLTASEEGMIKGQIERNWNLGSLAGASDLSMIIEVRITLQPDGTVTRAQVVNSGTSPLFRQASEGAVRAVMLSSPLKLPPGKTYSTMLLRFDPAQVVQ
ncbi:cell envelope integrity protein TolA [Dongia deserti]|uniref:cell envelope integrity protein TolA n=1 Tax=Dongia deserti TaxID=2268030 RepID=UPI000E65D1BA|nr:cell envelope integrity protein TolA [Dongia deserti]